MLDFDTRRRLFVRERIRCELEDLELTDAEALRQELRMVLGNPCDATIRTRFRNLVERFSEEFTVAIAKLDGIEPLDWWRSARSALATCGMRMPTGSVLEETPAERRVALRKHIELASRHPDGGACYLVANAFTGPGLDDPSYGPLLIDGWKQGDSPTISICIGAECIPAEPVHVLDAFLLPVRLFEVSAHPSAAAAARILEQVIDGAVRQLEEQFEDEFLLEVEAEHRARGISA